MTLREQVYAQAVLLAGELSERQSSILNILCACACSYLEARLRTGLNPGDCKVDFIASASLLALAALGSAGDEEQMEQITAGDFTIRKKSGDAASNCLRTQAELMMAPYLKDSFSFAGV